MGSISWLKEKEAPCGVLLYREYAVSWTRQEQEMISNEVERHHHILLPSGHTAQKDCVICIPKKVIPMENKIMEESVWQGLYEHGWRPCRNAHVLLLKKNQKFWFITSTISANRRVLEDARILSNIEEFAQDFTGPPMTLVIDFDSVRTTILLKDSQDYLAIDTMQGM